MEDEGNPWEDKFPSFNGKNKKCKNLFIYINLAKCCLKGWKFYSFFSALFFFVWEILCILCIMHWNAFRWCFYLLLFSSLKTTWRCNAQCYCYCDVNNHVNVNIGVVKLTEILFVFYEDNVLWCMKHSWRKKHKEEGASLAGNLLKHATLYSFMLTFSNPSHSHVQSQSSIFPINCIFYFSHKVFIHILFDHGMR